MNEDISKIFSIGPHRHLCADATQAENYKILMNEQQAQLLLADPPYCLLTRRNKAGQLRDPKRAKINHEAVTRYENVRAYMQFTKQWLHTCCQHLTENAVLCIWTNFLGKAPITAVCKELGYNHFYGEYNWVKLTKEGGGNEKLARLYEVALVFSKVPASLLNSDSPAPCWTVLGHYDDHKEAGKWENHPNHKSFNVLGPLIRNFSRPGDLVLDPFTGSGSTPAACIKLERIIAGLELRDKWAKITRERMATLVPS